MSQNARPKLTIDDVMRSLGAARPIFHSEADFQHAFAWELHQRRTDAAIRLERPVWGADGAMHLDFLMETSDQAIAVELKYKTKKMRVELLDEVFETSAHAGQPLGRYDFIKDVWRLEQISTRFPHIEGWAILLTNDSAYWRAAAESRGEVVDPHFRLHDGCVLEGELAWGERARGTRNKRERAHDLSGSYPLRWRDYSELAGHPNGRFRYLALNIARLQQRSG